MNIKEIIRQGEGTTIEFKEVLNKAAFKTLSGFANTDGGVVVLGVTDRKEAIGITINDKFIQEIVNRVVHNLGIHPSVERRKVDRKTVVLIKVDRSTLPISFEGRYFKRVGNTTREMQGEELRRFFIRGTNWDGLTGEFSLEEIDDETMRTFIRMARNCGRLPLADTSEDVMTILEKLKLVMDGRITNAALILFGKDPQRYFINASVRIGRFRDETTITGDRLIHGNLFQQVEKAEETLKNFINVRYEIAGESLVRKNVWEYPLEAIREGLLNMIIHRDYFRYNVQAQVKVFDDELWFFNIGGLPEGITLEQLKTVHPSVARNPLIVHVFYLAGLIEEYGSGIGRMMKALDNAGLPDPEFREEFGGFSLYLRKDPFTEDRLKELGLNARQIQAVVHVKKMGSLTNTEYQELCGTSQRSASRDLAGLAAKQILILEGTTGKGTRYVLMTPQRRQVKDKDATKAPAGITEVSETRGAGLRERQHVALDYARKHGSITLSEYATLIDGVSRKTLHRDLKALVEKALLRERGEKKGRSYHPME